MVEFLYIHIPFCIKKCLYCDFISIPYNISLVEDYINALCKELTLKKHLAKTLKSIYIGGGTPSILSEKCFQQIFLCLKDNYNLSSYIEITVEVNPGMFNESKLTNLLSLGVNRISIGIQSFDNRELQILGRIHNSADAIKAITLIKKSGLKNYSIDLMYGIPGQTIDSWKKSLSKAIAFSPSHISAYELTLEENTPLFEIIKKWKNKGTSRKLKMLDEDIILQMYNYTIDYLANSGFEHYEISNFAVPGYNCLHNINYWDRGQYIGTGVGAHSFIGNLRSENTGNIYRYIEDLRKSKIPETYSIQLTPDESLKELIFLGLRKRKGVNISKLKVFKPILLQECEELFKLGYMVIEKGHLRLTRKGINISNKIVLEVFDSLGL
ncbi:MAG: radical SAM family heme chaperone HemW [Nitrospirae bacterium]|nr:radical SAM family heme chaperone HemW [Nitrospirota bacterium]